MVAESPHPLQRLSAQGVQPGQGKHQMGAPLGVDQGMELVDNHRPCRAKHVLPRLAGEHQVEGLRRDDQDMRRLSHHPLPLPLIRVPGTDSRLHEPVCPNALERTLQIFTDIDARDLRGET